MLVALALLFLIPLQAQATEHEGLVSDFQATSGLGSWCAEHITPLNIIMCAFGLIVSAFLEIIIMALGLLILIVIEVLMVFATYNNFGDVQIVRTGWAIVRDLANMFFIVILLISAFATIIGYDKGSFHYTKVLPKLLLMAVLVNFSRTIILVLVDFSQVIMLTFVNAFQQSAAGNFVNGLGMTKVLSFPGAEVEGGGAAERAGAAGTAGGDISITNIIVALMLAVFLLSVMLATMLVMTIYLIARIVGIWVALIFSPAAFLATALPQRLKKGLGTITDEYWGKLAGLLTGGPIMAFFLWLTLSSIQATSGGSGGLSQGLGFTSQNEIVNTLINSGIGDSQAIASFIVGIALMLIGVSTAIKSSAAISSSLGGLSTKVASTVQGLGARAALYPTLGVAREIDRRADITGRVSRGALQTVGRVPVLGAALRPALLRGATMRRREAAAEKADALKMTSHLDEGERASVQKVYGKSAFASMGDRASAEALISSVTTPEAVKNRTKARASELMKEKQYAGMKDQNEAKRLAGLKAGGEMEKATAALVKEGRGVAERSGDFAAVEKYEKILAENPVLSGEGKELQKTMGKLRDDPEKLKGMSKEAKQNVAVALEALPAETYQEKDGKVVGFDQAKLDSFYEKNAGNKELIDTVKQTVAHVQNTKDGVSKEELMTMKRQDLPGGKSALYGVATDADGKLMKDEKFKRYERKRSGRQKAAGSDLYETLQRDPTAIDGVKMTEALDSGIGVSEVINMGNATQKNQMNTYLEAMSEVSMKDAAAATDKAALDKAFAIAMPALSQLDEVGGDVQIKILSGVQKGGGAKTISAKWNMADFTQHEAMQKVMKQAVRRAEEVSRKRAADPTFVASNDEKDIEKLVSELRAEFPATRRGTPGAVRKILHEPQT